MAKRFRKSIKIAPGVKMNVGKRGPTSISAGSFNFGKRGVHQNIKIPGTGLSYRPTIVKRSKKQKSRNASQQTVREIGITLQLQEDGSVLFKDNRGRLPSDEMIKVAKKQNRKIILDWLDEQRDLYNSVAGSLLMLHINTPKPEGEIILNPKPESPNYKKHGLSSKLFSKNRERTDKENEEAKRAYEKTLKKWAEAEDALHTDVDVMGGVLSGALGSIEWPRETIVDFDIVNDGKKVLIDVDLPEIEDMPTQEAKVHKRKLALTIKDLSQKQQREDYLTHIHAIGFRIIGDVFAYLPSVSEVVFSGFSQRTSKKTKDLEDEYLYSVRISRDAWEQTNFKKLKGLDVVKHFGKFELRRDVARNRVITPITPFED